MNGMARLRRIVELQDEIDILTSERGACDAMQRQRIDRRIDDLLSMIDVLREACE